MSLLVVCAVMGRMEKVLSVEVSLDSERYLRSSRSTVEDLKVRVTVTNLSNKAGIRFPAPTLGLLRGTPFTALFYEPALRKWRFDPLFPWFKKGERFSDVDVDELARIIESGKRPGRIGGALEVSRETSQAMQEMVPAYFKQTTDIENADLAEIERRLRAGEGPILVARRVAEVPGAEACEPKTAMLPPGESCEFEMEIGPYFDFYEGGTYGVACSILGIESNVARFEVLPVMRTDLRPDQIISRLVDLENGSPRYETMFYLCRAPFPWDEVVCVRRHVPPYTRRLRKATKGLGGLQFESLVTHWPNCPWPQAPQYEMRRLFRYKPGTTPKVMVSGTKTAFLMQDALKPGYWLYTVDLSRSPARIERRKAGEREGPEPSLSVDHQGEFQVM